jgi:Spy/CpxP family protein refolding chaperone
MRRYIYRMITGAGVLALLASAAFAQNPPAQKQPGGEGQRRMGRPGREHRPGGRRDGRLGLGRLNLSDAQREQMRGIESRYATSFRARREELRTIMQARRQGGTLTAEQESRARQLREELRADGEKQRTEMRGVLTEEQRAQLQTLRDEMRQRREEFRERRNEFREQRRQRRQQQQPPAPPNSNG